MPGSFDKEYEEVTVLHQAVVPSQPTKGKSLATVKSAHDADTVAAKMDKMTLGRCLDLSIHPIQESLRLPALYRFTGLAQFRSAIASDNGLSLYEAISRIVDYSVTTNKKVMEEHSRLNEEARVQAREVSHLKRELCKANKQLEDHSRENSIAQAAHQKELLGLQGQLDAANDQLNAANDQLDAANDQLDAANDQLDVANNQSTNQTDEGNTRTKLHKKRQEHLITGKELDAALRDATQLQSELSQLQKNPVATAATGSGASKASGYWARSKDPSEKLIRLN
ncbi:hypothetical protein MMC07_009819, partial [Pseudocyphellaria aurata]|nr:hypothetical protein [Pseudocyphellaria aurata]